MYDLGMFDELPSIKVGVEYLEKDALLVAYTDGLIEMEELDGAAFEDENLADYIRQNNNLDVKDFNEGLLKNLDPYKSKNLLIDDITLLSFRAL